VGTGGRKGKIVPVFQGNRGNVINWEKNVNGVGGGGEKTSTMPCDFSLTNHEGKYEHAMVQLKSFWSKESESRQRLLPRTVSATRKEAVEMRRNNIVKRSSNPESAGP